MPFAATFSSLVFDPHVPLPAWTVAPLIPDGWKPVLASAGISVSLAWLTALIYALCWLGRSMGIVVSVREVVLAGPYRWVRHPIYGGYLLVMLGMFMVSWTPRMALVVIGGVALLVWRARMEERLLSVYSPGYGDSLERTGFLWPRRQPEIPGRLVAESD